MKRSLVLMVEYAVGNWALIEAVRRFNELAGHTKIADYGAVKHKAWQGYMAMRIDQSIRAGHRGKRWISDSFTEILKGLTGRDIAVRWSSMSPDRVGEEIGAHHTLLDAEVMKLKERLDMLSSLPGQLDTLDCRKAAQELSAINDKLYEVYADAIHRTR